MMLSEAQRTALLAIARRAVETQVRGGAPAGDEPAGDEAVLILPGASGVFVTLKRRGELRGCLGTLECRRPLDEEVARCAADSASEDPRFPPVADSELPDLSLEISVLGPLEQVDPIDPFNPGEGDAIAIGRHGLVVEQGPRRGLLLPQVAVEWGWTIEQFLSQTCRKATLPEDAWRHGAAVYRFEAEVFGE